MKRSDLSRKTAWIVLLCALVAVVVTPALSSAASPHAAAIAKKKKKHHHVDPATAKLPPTANAGLFLGYPTYTTPWHGCTKTAIYSFDSQESILASAGVTTPDDPHHAITMTFSSGTAPYESWVANPGWKICGVQANAVLANPTVDSQLLAGIGYTSQPLKGSSAPSGVESIHVNIPKNSINRHDYRKFEGKTYSISEIVDLIFTVTKT